MFPAAFLGWSDTHLGDRSSLDLAGQQYDLAHAIFALKKPTVVLLLNGRPPSVVEISEKADALIEGWYLGQEGGTAVADLLFGDANPSGKLPVVAGAEVPQVYLGIRDRDEPPKRLVGWSKIDLAPGESRKVSITVSPRQQSIWIVDVNDWKLIPGSRVYVGASSRDIRLDTH